MDNPDARLFPNDLETLKSNEEEEEDLEEQKRRQAELENLLTDGIQAFKYDDSTINSSANVSLISDVVVPGAGVLDLKYDRSTINSSMPLHDIVTSAGGDNSESGYRDITANDQLKFLYDVKVREIEKIVQEQSQFRSETAQQINVLKNKVILGEAEMRQVQLSLANAQNLLADKTDQIKALQGDLNSKDDEVLNLQKIIKEYEIEVSTYQANINELHMKLADHNATSRTYQTDERQKASHAQIERLEALLDAQTNKNQCLERDYFQVQQDLRQVMQQNDDLDSRNSQILKALQNSQQQAVNLFNINDCLKQENEHLQERLKQTTNSSVALDDSFRKKLMDNDTLLVHLEKMRSMLLDSRVEMNSLESKLKCYESDTRELFEYRQLIIDIHASNQNQLESCDNRKHMESLIIFQHELKNCRQTIADRDSEITRLHSITKELEGKIEEMLQKTRDDIQNLSHKYSIPQLEVMSNDLNNAERKIAELEAQLQQARENEVHAANITSRCVELERQLDGAMQQLEQSRHDVKSDNKEAELRDDIARLKITIDELTRSKEMIERDKVMLDKRLAEVIEEKRVLLNDLDKSSIHLQRLHAELIKKESSSVAVANVETNTSNHEQKQQPSVETDLLKEKLKIDHLQSEHTKEILDIEGRYQKALDESNELNNKLIGKLKEQEMHYRQQFSLVLRECGEKIASFEDENLALSKQLTELIAEYNQYKESNSDDYNRLIEKSKRDCEVLNSKWRNLLEYYTVNYIKIEKKCHDKMGGIVEKINQNRSQMKAIEKQYDDKIRELTKKSS